MQTFLFDVAQLTIRATYNVVGPAIPFTLILPFHTCVYVTLGTIVFDDSPQTGVIAEGGSMGYCGDGSTISTGCTPHRAEE